MKAGAGLSAASLPLPVKYVRGLAIVLFGSLLSLAVAGIAGAVVHVMASRPGIEFVVAGVVAAVGLGMTFYGAFRSLRPMAGYVHCPACAMPVGDVRPGPDGTCRCPACGQWLGPGSPT